MKQLYILIFSFSCFGFAQYNLVQIELVDANIGQPVDGPVIGVTSSNDDGLNQIFASNNIVNYQNILPEAYLGENGAPLFYIINCDGCDVNQFVSDLNAYSTVVRYAAEETVDGMSVNVINLELVDGNVGVLTGTNNDDLITTNDVALTQIFQNFNVRTYIQNPSDSESKSYSVVCNCDAQLLETELNNYATVIASASDVFYGQLLSVEEVIVATVNIYPNPFKDKTTVEINKPLERVMLYDILGKQVYDSDSIRHFEIFSSTLKSGVYLLKLQTSEGESITKKLIKT